MTAADRISSLWYDHYSLADWTSPYLVLTVRHWDIGIGPCRWVCGPRRTVSHHTYPTSRRCQSRQQHHHQRYRLLLRDTCDVPMEVVILPLETKASSERQDLRSLKLWSNPPATMDHATWGDCSFELSFPTFNSLLTMLLQFLNAPDFLLRLSSPLLPVRMRLVSSISSSRYLCLFLQHTYPRMKCLSILPNAHHLQLYFGVYC